ncbi:Desiccation-related protein PCC13-62 [Capsicum baccatum]|uniref:Desiccation-related protein PCC13-62 n=1 Tax=Capsicum baccatum TaxID=33114 RepID=A0A2G2VS47_CAPBA|nr:Desiccation-related protein PCC13-62 [Capsicum baccatum]
MPKLDVDLIEFPLNLEYLEAEFFLWGSLGYGLDKLAPELADSGWPPIGAQIVKLSPLIKDVITQFGFQEVRHLRVESSQDAILRELLYERGREKAEPYGITVEEFRNQISKLSNKQGRHGMKDEGLNLKSKVGVERRIRGNVLAGDKYLMAYDRTPKEILRIEYGSGKKNKSGGFYPNGAEGRIAKSYLRHEH